MNNRQRKKYWKKKGFMLRSKTFIKKNLESVFAKQTAKGKDVMLSNWIEV